MILKNILKSERQTIYFIQDLTHLEDGMLENHPIGIYIHVPFCKRKCGYCDFYSMEGTEMARAWADAVIEEIEGAAPIFEGRMVDTLYVGGGTPSFVQPKILDRVFDAAYRNFDLTECVERTVECNPGTIDPKTAKAMYKMGFNRASLGVQSFSETELLVLDRIHTVPDIYSAVESLSTAGFSRINMDLIFGIPGQLLRDFEANIRRAVRLSPEHISVYGLTVEPGTPIFERFERGDFKKVHDELYEAMFLTAHALLESMGYRHYEISNYSRPGSEALHNLNCWRGRDYAGFGPSAHSRNGVMRWSTPSSLHRYMESPSRRILTNMLTDDQARLERIMLGLRTLEGIPRSLCGSRGTVENLAARGLLFESGGRLRLTVEGMLVIDEIILQLEGDPCLTLN